MFLIDYLDKLEMTNVSHFCFENWLIMQYVNWKFKSNKNFVCHKIEPLMAVFSNTKPIVFLHSLFLKNIAQIGLKKYQDNLLKFISSQLPKFGLVLSKTKNQPKLSLIK